MVQDKSLGSRLFDLLNYAFLTAAGVLCLAPFLHILAVSLSKAGPVAGNLVGFVPIDPTLQNFITAFENPRIWNAFFWAVARAAAGTALSVAVCVLAAYPMSRPAEVFPARIPFVVLFLFCMLFSGGLIPFFLVVRALGMYDTFLALFVPFAFSPWITILIMNFFRNLPKELEEAALIDGATHFDVLFRVFLPLSLPVLATVSLFQAVFFWNDWFYPSLLLKNNTMYPLQTWLQVFLNQINVTTLFASGNLEEFLALVSNRGLRAATLLISIVPILLVYPLLQRYFVKGLVLGAVKG